MKIGAISPMEAQKEVVRYGWHDCLNGHRGAAEEANFLGTGNDA